ncbi:MULTISPECIES: sensor histidine kinase [unclassified Rhodanobacter]|uniref:sensor histidine kinase n=1 Tax=unclassified Rhodanobacter TaxID=2621553 RepID=UPI001BE0098C|nr:MULTISPECIES: sensor histidine kinase [unclassified Rhodanobacter]MBT2145680.1 sensor histidine kinase [Rhodanobacter sp. LX-99]MBT2149823.1 sensor histidine kinase [Rhodanobacter sp. LX-100]
MPKLRPRARIVRTIGDQLISGPEAALIELVKNAFDADSPSVRITISPPADGIWTGDNGTITVSDAGHGMSGNDLLEKWFEPATSDKVERRLSPKNRTMLGAKGVGRFATARLGKRLHLRTARKIPGHRLEISEIDVNWDRFEQATYLDQIDIPISTKPGGRGEAQGVRLEIHALRDKWTKKQLEQLIRELRRLASPIRTREDEFRIYLDLSGFHEEIHGFDGQSLVSGLLAGIEEEGGQPDPTEIRPFGIDRVFHYMVKGTFDSKGRFKGTLVNQRGDAKAQPIDIPASELQPEEASCGKVNLRLNIYDREGNAIVELFEKLGLGGIGRLDAKRVLDENIGIGIYRNGFRIRPYGDAETDWLELERMRVQNPSRKLGLNQVWGLVEIQGEKESGLVERSSREGLEHNGAFERLKRLVTELLAQVESIRQDFRQTAGLSRKSTVDTGEMRNRANLRATTRAVADLPLRYRNRIERAIKQDSVALKTSIAELETYQQVLASRSTLGLVVSQVLHDGRRYLSDISTRSKRLADGAPRLEEQSAFGSHFRASFGKEAKSVHSSAGHLSKLFKSLDPISGKKRGRPKIFSVEEIIDRCINLYGDALGQLSIESDIQSAGNTALVTGYESDLMAAVLNIIDNAVHWLGSSPVRPRRIRFAISQSKQYVRLAISNNGPVVAERFHANLFNPGFSLKTEGSGIGLAIAREAMRASKGDVAFDSEAEETTFVIEMRRAPAK